MEFNPDLIIPIVLAILFLVFGGARRRKPAQQPAQTSRPTAQNVPEVETANDSDVVFPPFMENFESEPMETEVSQVNLEDSTQVEPPIVSEQSEPVQEPTPERRPTDPPPIPVDSPKGLHAKPLPATSLIDLNPDTFRQGIILSEILGRPRTFRNRRRRLF